MNTKRIAIESKRSDLSIFLPRWCLGVATCLATLCLATTGNAQTVWTNPIGGSWHAGSNWAGGSPRPGGTALFNLGTPITVTYSADAVNAGLVVGYGDVSFHNTSASTRTYTVAGNTVITGSLAYLNVGWIPAPMMHLTSGGFVVNSGGHLEVIQGSKISTAGLITVGEGFLEAAQGSSIQAGSVELGEGGTSIAYVHDAGSQMIIGGNLVIGKSATAFLDVFNAAYVQNNQGYVGNNAGSDGFATVRGSGSQWVNSGDLTVGNSGNGRLDVREGGVVTALTSKIGLNSDSISSVRVSGNSSRLNITGTTSVEPVLVVGHNGMGSLVVDDGGLVTSNEYTVIGNIFGSSGAATVNSSGSQLNTAAMSVGNGGNGRLDVQNGGVVTTTEHAFVGRFGGSSGVATITGSGSRWNLTESLFVGWVGGNGTLNVEAGGVVTNSDGWIGQGSGSATVTVTGSGSQWNNSEELIVGGTGSATLYVTNGGVVSNSFSHVGGQSADVTVTGSGSRWINSDYLLIGRGALRVENGGVVTSSEGRVGSDLGSTGAVTVTGIGSQWNSSGGLRVGWFRGDGTLNVESGGLVSNTFGHIGEDSDTSGTATVTGIGSQWNNTAHLYVGSFGNGTLNVTAGGVVNNTVGSIAQENGSSSTATVTGSGSQWNNSNILVVGNNSGNGTLNVSGGGVVTNTQGFIANEGASIGVVTVNGSGSRWINSSNLYVGHKGAGTLNVQNGGEVTNTNANIGLHVGTSGVATVTGAGSKWTNSEYLVVGSNGNGTLNILAGGAVTNTDSVIGFVPGSVGTALVTGATSKWTNSGFLIVGNSGTGTFTVSANGAVTNTDAAVGKLSGSSGTATVTGAGSKWTSTGYLAVGESGAGALTVSAGGMVANNGWGHIGYNAGSTGTVTVTGSGSQWNNSDSLEVGRFGAGTLNIADGGSVSVVNLTVVNADGQINNTDGSFVSNTVINQVGGEILGRGSFSAVGGWSNSGFMAFRGGVSNVYGGITNQPGGTIFGEFFGTTYFHGDVVHNGNQIAVGAGSHIEFQATVSGAGNYFSGGTIRMNGAFRPGNGAGVVSVANELSFGAGASLEIEIGGLTAGSQHDKLNIGNNLALNGELKVSLINGFNPSAGQSFNILDWGSLAGTFSSLSLPTLAGLAWNTSQLYTTGALSIDSASLPGDFDLDGDVDGRDFLTWQRNPSVGDLADWQSNYGAGPLVAANVAVPEPTTLILLTLVTSGGLLIRTGRTHQ